MIHPPVSIVNPAKKTAVFVLIVFLLNLGLWTLNLSSPPPSLAIECPIGPWYEQTPCQFYQRVKGKGTPDNEIFGERYTYAQINWIFNSLYNIVMPAGIGDEEDLKQFILKFMPQEIQNQKNPSGGYVRPTLTDYAQLGLPGLLLGGISESLSYPPASGIQEVRSLATKIFDIGTGVQPAYAQGYGFGTISVVQTLWTATRNMAYLITIILLIAAGFAIMFRVKINPQTVVSLQIMIPKLALSLLLITFSYAIAGLVIDFIYIVITAVLSSLSLLGVVNNMNFGSALSWFTSPSYGQVVAYSILPWLIIALLGTGNFSLFNVLGVLSGFYIVVALIAIVFLAWNLFKIWWMLVKTQITLIFLIAVGPLQIMLDLIPSQSGFGSWFRNIVANASVFATVPIMFMLNMLFWQPLLGSNSATYRFIVSLIPNLAPLGMDIQTGIQAGSPLPNLPFVNGSGLILNFAVGYVILALTPKVADMIRDALKVPAFKYGAALGEAVSPLTKPLGGGLVAYGKQRGGFTGGVIQVVGEGVSSFKG